MYRGLGLKCLLGLWLMASLAACNAAPATNLPPSTPPLALSSPTPTNKPATSATLTRPLPTPTPPQPTSTSTRSAPIATDVQLPPGFRSTVFAQLDGPRFMTYGADGALYVAERGANRVVALVDADNDGAADAPIVVADNLIAPSSLAFAPDGLLYVGETTLVTRLELDPATRRAVKRSVVIDGLPSGGHNTRTVLFGSKGELYVSIGSSCNVCVEKDERRAAIMVYDADGRNGRVFARGLRNAVGLALHPATREVWVTNHGRDWLGDNSPSETVYIAREGLDAGWPRCHSARLVDPEFGQAGACEGVAKPVIEMQAHSAPLALAFYTGAQFPPEYRNGVFVAFHGSWNRTVPTG